MIALVIDKDLGLVGQPPKGSRMDNAVAVALKRRTHRMLGLRMETPSALLRLRRVGRETDRGDHSATLPCPAARVHPGREVEARTASWRAAVTVPGGITAPARIANISVIIGIDD